MSNYQDLKNNGYIIVRELYSSEEIKDMREKVLKFYTGSQGEVFTQDAINHPELWPIWKKVLSSDFFEVVKDAVGTDDICFCHHSDLAMNRSSLGFHRDTLNDSYRQRYAKTGFWDTNYPYTNYRLALYLQDCPIETKLGLSVKPKSHLSSVEGGREQYLETKSGDLIIFDARLLHVGTFTHWSMLKEGRIALFFNFGIPNQTTTEHSQGAIARQMEQLGCPIESYKVCDNLKKVLDANEVSYEC